MDEQKVEAEAKPKEYSLSEEERALLESIFNLRDQHQYTASLMDRDASFFVQTKVKTRLGISNEYYLNLDMANNKVYALQKPKQTTDETIEAPLPHENKQ